MTILVTGATGFVGAGIVRWLAANHPAEPVIAADLFPSDSPMDDVATTVRLDVTDRAAVRHLVRAARPSRIVHAAAITPADEFRRAETFDINVGGTVNVLEAAAGIARRVVVASSSGVYAATGLLLRDEEHPVAAAGAYAASKLAAEAVAASYGAVAVRIGPAFGPGERARSTRPRISTIGMLADALAAGCGIALSGREVARDWTFVDDISAGIEALLFADTLNHAVYNLSAGRAETLGTAAEAFARHGLAVTWTDAGAADIALGQADARPPLVIARIAADTLFRPRHTLESGIAALVAAHR